MAKLSAHLRVYEARYPERQVATEGRAPMADLITVIAAMRDARPAGARGCGPTGRWSTPAYVITGELIEPFRSFEPGERVSAEVVSTYRYDTYGLLIEQWIQIDLQRVQGAARSEGLTVAIDPV